MLEFQENEWVITSHTLSTPQTKNQVQGRLFLDVVVAERATIFQLLPSKDQTLLVWWNALLVLNLGLHILNRVTWLDLESDCLAGERLDEDLHSTPQTENQVQGRLFLDVVVAQCTTIFQLLASKDQTLLVWWNALLVLSFHTRRSITTVGLLVLHPISNFFNTD